MLSTHRLHKHSNWQIKWDGTIFNVQNTPWWMIIWFWFFAVLPVCHTVLRGWTEVIVWTSHPTFRPGAAQHSHCRKVECCNGFSKTPYDHNGAFFCQIQFWGVEIGCADTTDFGDPLTLALAPPPVGDSTKLLAYSKMGCVIGGGEAGRMTCGSWHIAASCHSKRPWPSLCITSSLSVI